MKKTIFSLGVIAAAAISLVSCQKEISAPDENPVVKGTPFEIIATSADTKTINNGLETKWAGNESINLFYAAAGSSTYNNGGEFTTTESGASVKFNGTIDASKLGDSNDWYAFYPYKSQIETPANTSGYAYIGGRSDASQQQSGLNSKAHLAGENHPMYAVVPGVEKGTTPELAFNHLASVIKVHVTNSTSEPVAVSSVSFTAPEDIVGQYFIDFSTKSPAYTAATYTSSTASLNVTNAEIAAEASADFYLAIKPFTAPAGSTLKLTVNGSEKAIELTKDVTFTAGHIKPLNFKYEKQEEQDFSGEWLIIGEKKEDHSWNIMNQINGKYYEALSSRVSGKVFNDITLDDFSSIDGIEDCVFIVTKSGAGYSIKNNKSGKYVARNSADLKESDSEEIWNIKLASGSNIEISDPTNSSNKICYNSGNPRFKTYTSNTMNPIYFVKWVSMPKLSVPEIEVTKNADDPYTIDVVWLDVDNATSYVVTCTGQEEQTIGKDVMETSFSGLTDGDYVVTVTAMAEGFKSATATSENIHIGLASRNLTFTDATKTIAFGETYTNVLTGAKTDDVTYSITHSDGSAVTEDEIMIEETTGDVLAGDIAGEYTITATAPATAEYAAGTASYTLIVKEDNYETDGTLATWTFASDNYPTNKTDFINNGVSDKCIGCTFNLNGSGSTWNTAAGKGYAFTAVTDITITIKAYNTLKKGARMILSMNSFYNKATNAPMKGFNITVKNGDGVASTTGCDKTSWSLTTSSSNYTLTYTLQNDVEINGTISFILTQTGKAGSGQGYVNNVKVEYNN